MLSHNYSLERFLMVPMIVIPAMSGVILYANEQSYIGMLRLISMNI
jgi:hypothetical protein